MKIRHKLIIGFLIIGIFLFFSGYFAFERTENFLLDSIGNDLEVFAHETMKSIDRSVYHRIEDFQVYTSELVLQKAVRQSNQIFAPMDDAQDFIDQKEQEWRSYGQDEVSPFMQTLIDNELSEELRQKIKSYNKRYAYPLFGEIFITNKFGANIALTSKTTDYRQDDEQWWQKAKEEGLFISQVEYDNSADMYSIEVCVRIDDTQGNFLGIMKAVLNVQYVFEILEDIAEEVNNEKLHGVTLDLKLIDQDLKYIYSTEEPYQFGDKVADEFILILKNVTVQEDTHWTAEGDAEDEDEELLAAVKSYGFKDYKGLGWILIVENEKRALWEPIKRLEYFLVTLLILLMATVFFAGLFLYRSIATPLAQLVDAAFRIGRGDVSARVTVRSNDEIGQLANSFNEMAQGLEKTTTSVDRLNEEITQRKKTEADLAEIARIPAENPNPIMRISKDGILLYANGAGHALLDMWSSQIGEMAFGDVQVLAYETFAENRTRNIEFKAADKVYMFYVVPLAEYGYVAMYAIDITDQKSVEKELVQSSGKLHGAHLATLSIVQDLKEEKSLAERLKDEAQSAAKAKSNFLANMSHEIRTPMNSILGFSDLLRKTKLDEKQEGYLKMVESSGKLLIGIIDDILDVSKLESGKIKLETVDFNLEDLIHEVFAMIVTRMKDKPFDTYVDIDDDVPVNVQGDPTRFKQILVNLLGNAVKFTQEGSIGVEVSLDARQKSQDSSTVNLLVKVKDTGIGIPKDKTELIFDAFSQADESTTRQFGGTGLGLAICKSLVEAMDGKIWIESEEGKGSTFLFTASLKVNDAAKSDKTDLSIKALEGMTVFIVDDNKIARKVMHKCCDTMGLKIFGEADSPQSALHKLDNLAEGRGIIPDFILCDIIMEGMDGFELAQKIKENKEYKHTKFIAVTADLEAESSEEAEAKVFDAFVNKPVNVKEMSKVITGLMGKKEDNQEKEEKGNTHDTGIKVLVAEDSISNQELIKAYFEELGFEGDYAENGKIAVEMLKNDNNYDLCLMDLQMPEMGGIEAAEIIRKDISKDLPVIALTASVLQSDQDRVRKSGMNDFLAKPIDIDSLREKILEYVKKS